MVRRRVRLIRKKKKMKKKNQIQVGYFWIRSGQKILTWFTMFTLDLVLDKDWLLESLLLYQSCKLVKFLYFYECNLNQGVKREPNGSNSISMTLHIMNHECGRAGVRRLFGCDYFQPFDLVGLWIFSKIKTHI